MAGINTRGTTRSRGEPGEATFSVQNASCGTLTVTPRSDGGDGGDAGDGTTPPSGPVSIPGVGPLTLENPRALGAGALAGVGLLLLTRR